MSEKQQELIELLKNQVTIDDLSTWFGLSQKQVYQRIVSLQNKGYSILRKDFANGKVQFGLTDEEINVSNNMILYTLPYTNSLRVIVSSDTHLGNTNQNLKALNEEYNYAKKNNINVIFGCGDLLNGLCTTFCGRVIDKKYNEQLEKALKNYPYDPSIINYTTLGNHDKDYLKQGYLNLKKVMKLYCLEMQMVS